MMPPVEHSPLVAVLAAGRGARFGGGKLDALLRGKAVGRWVLDAVRDAGLKPGVIVTGSEPPAFARRSGWSLIENLDTDAGLGSSLALAACQADAPLLVLLADMPLVEAEHLRKLVAAEGTAATRYPDGKAGVPALFERKLLPDIAALEGDRGAGALLAGLDDLTLIKAPAETLIDVDRPEDLARAEAIQRRV